MPHDSGTGTGSLSIPVDAVPQRLDVGEGVHKGSAVNGVGPAVVSVAKGVGPSVAPGPVRILAGAVGPHALAVAGGTPVVAAVVDTDEERKVACVHGGPEHWDMHTVDQAAPAYPGLRKGDASAPTSPDVAVGSDRADTGRTASGAQDAAGHEGAAYRWRVPLAFGLRLRLLSPVAARQLASFCDLLPKLLPTLPEVPARLFLLCIRNRRGICNIVS